jgi:hypothetical protein
LYLPLQKEQLQDRILGVANAIIQQYREELYSHDKITEVIEWNYTLSQR